MTTPPSKELTIVGLKKLVETLEKPLEGEVLALTTEVISQPAPAGEAVALMPKDDRARAQFRFWLDVMKDPEFELAQEIMLMKQRRKFAATIRDGLRLMIDLNAGHIDVLLQLFPWVKDAIMQEVMR